MFAGITKLKLSVKNQSITKINTQALIIGLFEKSETPRTQTDAQGLLNSISDMVAIDGFKAKVGEVTRVLRPMGLATRELILVGLGPEDNFDEEALTRAAHAAFSATRAETVSVMLDDWRLETKTEEWSVLQIAMAAGSAFEPLTEENHSLLSKRRVSIIVSQKGVALSEAAKIGEAIAGAVNRAKVWGNLPANICTPSYLADEAQKLAKLKGVTVKIHDEKAARKIGMNAFLAVAQGSREAPRFIELHYTGATKDDAPVCLVGKAITLDAGGLCLKPSAHITDMKYDMSGGAAVLAVFEAVASQKWPLNLAALIPACENLPDGAAYKPSDVIRTLSGKTVEITNTDAEGRLILADALSYSARFKPQAVIDVATLTGAVEVALGSDISGLFVNDPVLCDMIETSADVAHDAVWTLPYGGRRFEELLKSNVADCVNTGPRGIGGSCVAATFLSQFVDEDTPWAHLDVAATAFRGGKNAHSTGRPVPLLMVLLHQMAAFAE